MIVQNNHYEITSELPINSFIYTPSLFLQLIILQSHKLMQAQEYIDGYQVHGLLGEGGQANVYLGSKGLELYAIKVYHAGSSKEIAFKQEVEFLEKLKFKYLINIVESNIQGKVKLQAQNEMIRPIIVLEFAEGGELFDYIAKGGKFKTEICRSFFKMLIETIEYLDNIGVAHRDLKPENILFDKNFYLKVSDFGLSTLSQGHDGDKILYTRLGTEGYKPPEMEKGKYNGLQADLFAAGVILFVMYAGSPPFISTKDTDKVYKYIREGQYTKFWHLHEKRREPGFFSDPFKRLMNSFFSAQVEKRPSFESLKEDEWLNTDQAMQDEIMEDMKARFEIILQNDENKQKIEAAKVSIMKQSIMEEEDSCCGDNRSVSEAFYNIYKDLAYISVSELPSINKERVIPLSVNPAFAYAWLLEFIENCKANNETFMEIPCEQITLVDHQITFDEEQKKINIGLTYEIDKELETMKVSGKMIQLKESKLGVDWQKEEGNDFWLTAVISRLNQELLCLKEA